MRSRHTIKGNRERKGTMLEEAYKATLQYRIKQATTPAEKRELIAQVNPLFYVFGKKRKVFKPYLSYEENFDGA